MTTCGNSIVLRENIRKVYVNGRLDHEENLGIGFCAYEINGKGRVLTSWPKREKVLKINGIPYVYIGRTASGRPICWTTDEEYDRTSLLPIQVMITPMNYRASPPSISVDDYNLSTGASLRFEENNKDTISLLSYIGTPPDHYGERSKYVGESVVKDGYLQTDIDINGTWLNSENYRQGGSSTGYASYRVHVARLFIEMESNTLNASATAYGTYVQEDQQMLAVNGYGEFVSRTYKIYADLKTSVSGVSCEVVDFIREEEED